MSSMKSSEPSGVFRKRDFGIVCCMLFGIYLTLDTPSFRFKFEPAWYVDQRFQTMSSSYDVVPPIITDLNGDGENEIVVIAKTENDLILQVVSANRPDGLQHELYTPKIISSTKLLPLNVATGRIPVAMKTGYIDVYNPIKSRTQVIVIVREDWTVSCYDNSLKLLWEKAVAHKTHDLDHLVDKFTIDEMSIYLTPIHVNEDSESGLIIIGGSMRLKDPLSADSVIVEDILNITATDTDSKEQLEIKERAALEHFSLYALDGATGHVVWRHDGQDIHPGQYIRGLPHFAYTLDMHELITKAHHAASVPDWSTFRDSLIGELPHNWLTRDDTTLRMAHFERQHVGGNLKKKRKTIQNRINKDIGPETLEEVKEEKKLNRKLASVPSSSATFNSRFTGVQTPPLEDSASLPHDAAEHTKNPNVIVAHTSRGIEVVALKTGNPITSLPLSSRRNHADVDGDGIVDTITILEQEMDVSLYGSIITNSENGDTNDMQHCTVLVTSGLPTRYLLFQGTVCSTSHYLHDSTNMHEYDYPRVQRIPPSKKAIMSRTDRRTKFPKRKLDANLPSVISAAAPVILKTVDHRTLLPSKVSDIVIAINIGVVTCYSGNGDFRWQTRGGPRWEAGAEKTRAGAGNAVLFDFDAARVDKLGKHDNIHAQILVIGENSMSLISREGEVLNTVDLPKKPNAHPIIGDFDSDGVMDVIIITEEAILGYHLEIVQSTRGMFICLMVLCVLAFIIFIANIQAIPIDSNIVNQASQSANLAKIMKHSVLSIARSTDESHID